VTAPAKDHVRVVNGEIASVAERYPQPLEGNREVANTTAQSAHEVMMRVVDIGIDAHASGTEIENAHLAERFEVVHRLVHGLQRDRRELAANAFVQRVDGGVRVIAEQLGKDRLALGRDAKSLGSEHHSELIAVSHLGREPIDNDC
jgi:hypothetical protein